MKDRITKQEIICVQTDEYAHNNFKDIILDWADQIDGVIYVDIYDYFDLQNYCKSASYQLCELLQEIRERCEMEGVESVIFF